MCINDFCRCNHIKVITGVKQDNYDVSLAMNAIKQKKLSSVWFKNTQIHLLSTRFCTIVCIHQNAHTCIVQKTLIFMSMVFFRFHPTIEFNKRIDNLILASNYCTTKF